ncbi:rRNA-processing protein efg1 [Lachnellula suecica]|uniref:rRNA-processing protein EFG1 n=1 Tax=Lachnellula suecica TaxID=602035 RepID=A0A8T9CJG0_9HELO|nr:rRNA-processing protein efg1 [Lachnellula suecica]
MAGKRKNEEADPRQAVHESRQYQVYGNDNPKPAKKPRRQEQPKEHKKQAHASSVNDIKKRIRDVTRRLQRVEDLPADVRIEDERALAAYQQELAAAEAEKIRQKMISKYHMVRFFERQKATRQLKRLRKQILATESAEEVEALKTQMHVAEVDLNYTQNSPLSEPYISLYPLQKDSLKVSEDAPKTEDSQPKPAMWFEVEKCMEDSTLNKLRNRVGKPPVHNSKPLEMIARRPKAKPTPVPDTSGLNRRERRSQQRVLEGSKKGKNKSMGFEKNAIFGASQSAKGHKSEVVEDDDDSDVGFFEQ